MKPAVRSVEEIVTIRLDLRGDGEFPVAGAPKHKVVEVAWLTKSTSSHPIQATLKPSLRVKCWLTWAELPDEVQTALMLAAQRGDIPDVESWSRAQRKSRA
jgi:hypothetical protein